MRGSSEFCAGKRRWVWHAPVSACPRGSAAFCCRSFRRRRRQRLFLRAFRKWDPPRRGEKETQTTRDRCHRGDLYVIRDRQCRDRGSGSGIKFALERRLHVEGSGRCELIIRNIEGRWTYCCRHLAVGWNSVGTSFVETS